MNTNDKKRNVPKYKRLLSLYQKSNESIMFVGLHGVGKSAVVEQWCKENDIYLETILLSIKEIGDLIGSPKEINNYLHYVLPPYIENIERAHKEGKHVAIFFDELNRAYKDVKDASLQITLKGIIGDYILPKLNGIKTFIISAINPTEYYEVSDFDPALEGRFTIIDFELTIDDFLDFGQSIGTPKAILDFVALNPQYLHTFLNNRAKKTKTDKYQILNDRCATPRGWTQLGENLKNATNDDDILDIIIGRIGTEVGSLFYTFYKNYNNNVSIDEITNLINIEQSLDENTQKIKEFLDNNKQETNTIITFLERLYENIEFEKNIGNKNNLSFFAFANAINMELITMFINKLKIENQENYRKLALIDKSIFIKISNIVHNMPILNQKS